LRSEIDKVESYLLFKDNHGRAHLIRAIEFYWGEFLEDYFEIIEKPNITEEEIFLWRLRGKDLQYGKTFVSWYEDDLREGKTIRRDPSKNSDFTVETIQGRYS